MKPPLKAIARGYSWTSIPIARRNRRSGVAKRKISEMGSGYFFIVASVWLEWMFSRRDDRKPQAVPANARDAPGLRRAA